MCNNHSVLDLNKEADLGNNNEFSVKRKQSLFVDLKQDFIVIFVDAIRL